MWSLIIEIVDLCGSCGSADDVEKIWSLMNQIEGEAFFLLYDRVCALEDFYNDGRWCD